MCRFNFQEFKFFRNFIILSKEEENVVYNAIQFTLYYPFFFFKNLS